LTGGLIQGFYLNFVKVTKLCLGHVAPSSKFS
jgi:hypothetical protein